MTEFSLPLVLAQDAPAPPTPVEVETPAPPTPLGGDAHTTTTTTDGGATTGQPNQTQTPAQPPAFDGFMLILMLGFVLMFVFMMSGQRREKKKRAAMLGSLKKGDKVQTVGGVLGSVVEVRETEVVLKVDESSNTRMRFSRSAIQNVIEEKSE